MSTIQRRTATVDIYQGDYLDRLRFLERRFDQAVADEKNLGSRLAVDFERGATSDDLKAQHDALKAEAEESAIHVTLTALGRKQWRELVAAHKPREGNDSDAAVGVNEETFKDVLVAASIVEPEWLRDQLDDLADVDFDRLYLVAFGLNRAPAADPKALALPKSQQNSETGN